MTITPEIKNEAKQVKNWSAAGKEEGPRFWLKHLMTLHERWTIQFNVMFQIGNFEE